MTLTARAPAKINLSLHICGRRADGYHDLESLVAFAGAADLLTLAPGADLSLRVDGSMAQAAGPEDDNLVLRAARALAARCGGLRVGAFRLTKRLPVGAGIGGGSSDAAAALRLLALANGMAGDDPRLFEAAASVGADVPVCVDPRARMMRGIGERLGPPLNLPPLAAVLANPGVHLATPAVFRQIGLQAGESRAQPGHPAIPLSCGAPTLLRELLRARNDMETAAGFLAPVVADVLATLRAAPGCRLARMSGSGTTCFAVFDDCRAASLCAKAIRHAHAGWWVRSTVLR